MHSKPLCYDDNFDILTRTCTNSSWRPAKAPKCYGKVAKSATQEVDLNLVLAFDSTERKMYLIVYLPEDFVNLGNLMCLTDASDALQKIVKIKLVFPKSEFVNPPYLVYKLELEKYMGQYWCTLNEIRSNTVVGYKKRKGNEFALKLRIKKVCTNFECAFPQYYNFLDREFNKTVDAKVRIMEILNFNETDGDLDLLLHISTTKDRHIRSDFFRLKKSFAQSLPKYYEVLDFRSSEYCLNDTTVLGGSTVNWPITNLDFSVVPNEICLSTTGLPLTRVCVGSFLYGTEWSTVEGKCLEKIEVNSFTKYLQNVTLEDDNPIDHLERIVDLIPRDLPKYSVLDLFYLGTIIKRAECKEMGQLNTVIDIISSTLHANKSNLGIAQRYLNSSDLILDRIEDVAQQFQTGNETFGLIQKNNLIFHMSDPFATNISGLWVERAFLRKPKVHNLYRNESLMKTLNNTENLELAILIPEEIFEELKNVTGVKIVITIFLNDFLFTDEVKLAASKVVTLSITGYGIYLTTPIPILFKRDVSDLDFDCGYWDYGKNTHRKKGSWSNLGSNYLGQLENNSDIHICSFSHLSTFSLLIFPPDEFLPTSTDDHILNIITLIESILSLLGILGIFLTAITFKNWRQRQGTKILLNISVSIAMEIIGLQLAELRSVTTSTLQCTLVGVLLHYFVLSKFMWMLIYAFLQFLRFVRVFAPPPKNLILKAVLIGWICPLMPVGLVAFLSPDTYALDGFCYPSGLELSLGVVVPLALVILTNLVFFCLIMVGITQKNIAIHCKETHKRQIYLALLLFSMLGLPYWFLLFARMIVKLKWLSSAFVYIFYLSGALQGFVLFAFYVVFNRETRSLWRRYILNKRLFVKHK